MRPEMAAYEAHVDPAIVVVAYNRPKSLSRLLNLLLAANYDHRVTLIVSIDHGGSQDVVDIAESFHWHHGNKEVICHSQNLGILKHIMTCGDLTERYGSIIVLEDDLLVSPEFYRFSKAANNYYQDDPKIAGIGLYKNHHNVEVNAPFRPIIDKSDVLFVQYTCTWGQVWNKSQWRKFKHWYHNKEKLETDTMMPRNILNWASDNWDKNFNYYLVEHDLYFVYPQISLTTNFLEPGAHFTHEAGHFQVPVLTGSKSFRFESFDQSNAIYDIFWELSMKTFKKMVPALQKYDFEVDLLGVKPIKFIKKDYLLTTRKVSSSIMTFANVLVPYEMNVLMGLEGKEIALALKSEVIESNSSRDSVRMLYTHLSGMRLIALLQARVLRRIKARVGNNWTL
jgi:hypothetical protein